MYGQLIEKYSLLYYVSKVCVAILRGLEGLNNTFFEDLLLANES